MKRYTWFVLAILLVFLVLKREIALRANESPLQAFSLSPLQALTDNLLTNGNMEEQPFYWQYPNHYIAGGWNRWWIHGTTLPEYADTGLYRPHYDGEHAQAYFKWGASYTAGIYQVVEGVMPCTLHRFTMWARNHSLDGALPHARIGLDPQGTQLTSSPSEGAILSLPESTVWSWEQTTLSTWEQLAVEVESVRDHLTAILYASPKPPPDGPTCYFDTFWDAGQLTSLQFPNGRLPAPDPLANGEFITNVNATAQVNYLLAEWDTSVAASSQLWYTFTVPSVVTSTTPLTWSVYLPTVLYYRTTLPHLAYATPVDQTPVLHHHVRVGPFPSRAIVSAVALSRRPVGDECQTSASDVIQITIGEVYLVYLPIANKSP